MLYLSCSKLLQSIKIQSYYGDFNVLDWKQKIKQDSREMETEKEKRFCNELLMTNEITI